MNDIKPLLLFSSFARCIIVTFYEGPKPKYADIEAPYGQQQPP